MRPYAVRSALHGTRYICRRCQSTIATDNVSSSGSSTSNGDDEPTLTPLDWPELMSKTRRKTPHVDFRSKEWTISPGRHDVQPVEPLERVPVPRLAHKLDRVLFNPGVYYLQDPRSHVYNFDPYLQHITPVKDFNFDALTQYMTSSRDPALEQLAREHKSRIIGSTSSMTGVLSQFHYFISRWRPVNLRKLSLAFAKKSTSFTLSQRAPSAIYLRHLDGVYAIDADKSLDDGETVLSFLGRSMEKMLTLTPDEFAKLRKDSKEETPRDVKPEAFFYSKLGSLLMRSQLDCHDPRLPSRGTFDLKTRAVLPVRMNVRNTNEGTGYQIFQSTGLLESFEREYYDMIRAAFLKYSLQVRIGHMDGIFVAFHNTERIFGFQYISLDEMDDCIHGSSDQDIARREWVISLKLLDRVLHKAIDKYPKRSMCLTFEAVEGKKNVMNVVVEPMDEDEISRRQQGELLATLKAAQRNERIEKMPSSTASSNSKGTLESMSNTLEQMMMTPGATATDTVAADTKSDGGAAAEGKEVVPRPDRTMYRLEGTNVIEGKEVDGPPNPSSRESWKFKCTVEEVKDAEVVDQKLEAMHQRRIDAFTDLRQDGAANGEDGTDKGLSWFLKDLKRISEESRKKLKTLKKEQPKVPVIYTEMRP